MGLMYEMVLALTKESSTNGKMEIIKYYESKSNIIGEALKLCYNPFIVSNMKKIPVPTTEGIHSFEYKFYEFKALYENLDSRTISGKAAQDAVFHFLNSTNAEAQIIFINILKKDLRVKIGATLINNALGDGYIPQFEVQLANKYQAGKKYKNEKTKKVITHWYASPKLNGLRGYYDERGLKSRKGHDMHGFDHILRELEHLQRTYHLSFCDGELFDVGIPFQTIQSYVTRKKNIIPEHKERIKYNIFAVGNGAEMTTNEMISLIESIDWNRYTYIKPLQYFYIENDPETIYKKMLQMYDDGFEGLMLRHPETAYVYKRSNDLLKAKPMKEASFVIVGFEEGRAGTDIEGTLGAIIVEGIYDNKKIRCEVGSGFKMIGTEAKLELSAGLIKVLEEGMITRNMIWRDRDRFIGKTCEIQFQEVTDKPDPKTGCYSLQFPVFVPPKLDR